MKIELGLEKITLVAENLPEMLYLEKFNYSGGGGRKSLTGSLRADKNQTDFISCSLIIER